jgi:subtilisin-like proprotein convertase family protein
MMHRASSPRTRDRSQTRRLCSFWPALDALEDRIVLTSVGWAIDADPDNHTVALDPGDLTNPNRPAAVYVTGYDGNSDAVAKYTTDGILLWSRTFSGAIGYGVGWGVAVDPSGNAYISGTFSGTITIGSQTLTSAGMQDAYVAKLDPSGNALWARSFGSPTGDDFGYGVAADSSGAYLAGGFSGIAYFNNDTTHPVLTSAGGSDAFVLKLDTTGSLVYATRAGGNGTDSEYAASVAVNGAGEAFVTGWFSGTASFGSSLSLTSLGSRDAFIGRLDAAGNFTWVRQMGGSLSNGFEQAFGVALDGNGHVITTGNFCGTSGSPAAFGNSATDGPGAKSLVSLGTTDAFVASLDAATGHFLWTSQLGGVLAETLARELALDSSGNIYSVGDIVNSANDYSGPAAAVDFDPGPGTALLTSDAVNNNGGYLSKLSPSGSFLGAWKMGASNNTQTACGVAVAADGTIYTTGAYCGTASFDTGTQFVSLTSTVSQGVSLQGTFLAQTKQGLGAIFGRAMTGQTDNGAPIGQIGRTVTLINSAGSTVASTTSGLGGAFLFPHLAADTYTIREAALTGWTAPAATVTVGSGTFVTGLDLLSSSSAPSRTYTDSKSGKVKFGPITFTGFPLTISNTSTIYEIKIQVNITAPNDSALRLWLEGPDSTVTKVVQVTGIASGSNFVNTIFDDYAATPIAAGTGPYIGSFQPQTGLTSLLSAFNGKTLNGTWELLVRSEANQQVTVNSWSLIVIGSALGSPQLDAGPPAPAGAQAVPLSSRELGPIVHSAVALWEAAGITAAQDAALKAADVELTDLPAGYLGLTADRVWIDATADGYGWYIGPIFADDAHLRRPGQLQTGGKMDLLTVVAHELGHVLGLEDNQDAGDLMAETLSLGVRRLPTPNDVPRGSTAGSDSASDGVPSLAERSNRPPVYALDVFARPDLVREMPVTAWAQLVPTDETAPTIMRAPGESSPDGVAFGSLYPRPPRSFRERYSGKIQTLPDAGRAR